MKIEDIKVELRPHRGEVSTKAGTVEVELPQKVVFVNDVWAGYVGNEPGSHISIILKSLPDPMLAEIKRQVDHIRGSDTSKITQAKSLEQSIVPPAAPVAPSNPLDDLGL